MNCYVTVFTAQRKVLSLIDPSCHRDSKCHFRGKTNIVFFGNPLVRLGLSYASKTQVYFTYGETTLGKLFNRGGHVTSLHFQLRDLKRLPRRSFQLETKPKASMGLNATPSTLTTKGIAPVLHEPKPHDFPSVNPQSSSSGRKQEHNCRRQRARRLPSRSISALAVGTASFGI